MKKALIPALIATGSLTLVFSGFSADDMKRFEFADHPPADYEQVDRMGMPGVATAVITSKDAYNAGNPANDATGAFVGEITANVTALHNGLDDDLSGLGLTPATPAKTLAQAGPLIVPDTIKIDTTKKAGFPNGRRLKDPVIDLTLAVVLLDLGAHPVTTFSSLPVNPPANDKNFRKEFPYLADPF
jgi:hypothetical protein